MATTAVRMTVEWLVPPGQARSIALALHSLSTDLRVTPGCVRCSVSTDLTTLSAVRYTEEWESEADLRARVGSEAFLRLAELLEATDRTPHLEFTLPEGVRGVDFLEDVRGSSR
jgi:quinol monooxygenase YgiN